MKARLGATRFADLHCFDEVDSTNRLLADAARAGAPEGRVAVADHQSAGRGRLGRRWDAARGSSLLVSVLLRPQASCPGVVPDRLHLVVAACALAARTAVERVVGVRAGLKWPNDLVFDDRKLGGILAESVISGERVEAVVVGLGLNVRADAFPPELSPTAIACESLTGREVDRDDLLVTLLEDLDRRYGSLRDEPGTAALLAGYREACVTLGRHVRVELAGGAVDGVAVDVDPAGALVVETTAGERVAVLAGDVVHVRARPDVS